MKLKILLLTTSLSFAQTYQIINQENTQVSYRGLAFEDSKTFVVSGSKNTIGKTTDGGKTFQWINPEIVEDRDFRDIEVLNKNTYITVAIDNPAYILTTNNAGKTWQKQYENNQEGIFLDAIYHDKKNKDIYVIGDPIVAKQPYMLKAKQNNLNSWQQIDTLFNQNIQLNTSNEAFFASSGANLYVDNKNMLMATGGENSYLYHYTKKHQKTYPIQKNKSTTSGVNALAYNSKFKIGYLVGGDFTAPNNSQANFYKFKIKNNQIVFDTITQPQGYKSGVTIISKNKVLVCGYSGVDYSKNGGKTWQTITTDSYNTCTVAPNKKYVIMVGNKGKIGKMTL